MTQYRYAYQGYDAKKMARAVGIGINISFKQAMEICKHIKHRSLESARTILNSVLEMKQAIPYKAHNKDVPHRAGMMAGRYPQNASKEILKLLDSVEANANSKGLSNLYITHIIANIAPAIRRGGRNAGEGKRAHVEIVVEEKKVEKKKYTPIKDRKGKTK
ncbi:50S ribosomal protein L22 [Candidatus Woesearchaeota archaeon]|nr:50S ribosomal protein L22 [Candidatus Woesearchaeota archaeon]